MNNEFLGIVKTKNKNKTEYIACTYYERFFPLKSEHVFLRGKKINTTIDSVLDALRIGKEMNLSFSEIMRIEKEDIMAPIEEPRNLIYIESNFKNNPKERYSCKPIFFSEDKKTIIKPYQSIMINESDLIDLKVHLGIMIARDIDADTRIESIKDFIGGYFIATDIISKRREIENKSFFLKRKEYYEKENVTDFKPIGPVISPFINPEREIFLIRKRDSDISKIQRAKISEIKIFPQEIIFYIKEQLKENEMKSKRKKDSLKINKLNKGDIILCGTPSSREKEKYSTLEILLSGGKERFLRKLKEEKIYARKKDYFYPVIENLGYQEIEIT